MPEEPPPEGSSYNDTISEIAAYLAAQLPAIGLIRQRVMPVSPDIVLLVTEFGGFSTNGQFGHPGIKYENIGIQIKARGVPNDSVEPRKRIQTVFVEMGKIQAVSIGVTYYKYCQAQQSPFFFERDANSRHVYAVNFVINKELSV